MGGLCISGGEEGHMVSKIEGELLFHEKKKYKRIVNLFAFHEPEIIFSMAKNASENVAQQCTCISIKTITSFIFLLSMLMK